MKTNKVSAILYNVTRFEELMPLIAKRPLATMPFDCKYRLIDFQLSNIANANIRSLFSVFNEGETQSVFDHIGGGKEWNLDALQNHSFTYFYQNFEKKKEAGEPYFASIIDYLRKSKSTYTVFMTSRMLCNIDLKNILKIHQKQENNMTVVYKRMESQQIAEGDMLLELTETGGISSVSCFEKNGSEKEKENLSMDIFIIETAWLIEQLERGQEEGTTVNLLDFLRCLVIAGKTSAYEYTGYLSNIHDIQSYYQANMDMLSPAKFHSLMYSNQKIYTKLKNEVPTYYAPTSNVKNSQFATGCVIEGTVDHSLISRRSKVAEGALVKDSIIMAGAKIAPKASVKYAILDKNVIVDPGIRIRGTQKQPVVVTKGSHVSEDIIGEGAR